MSADRFRVVDDRRHESVRIHIELESYLAARLLDTADLALYYLLTVAAEIRRGETSQRDLAHQLRMHREDLRARLRWLECLRLISRQLRRGLPTLTHVLHPLSVAQVMAVVDSHGLRHPFGGRWVPTSTHVGPHGYPGGSPQVPTSGSPQVPTSGSPQVPTWTPPGTHLGGVGGDLSPVGDPKTTSSASEEAVVGAVVEAFRRITGQDLGPGRVRRWVRTVLRDSPAPWEQIAAGLDVLRQEIARGRAIRDPAGWLAAWLRDPWEPSRTSADVAAERRAAADREALEQIRRAEASATDRETAARRMRALRRMLEPGGLAAAAEGPADG